MPSLKRRVKTETSLPKIGSDAGRLKGIELSASGMANDVVGAPQARNLSDNQQRWGVQTGSGPAYSTKPDQVFVPVIDQNQQPLMPTIASRARRWIASGKATGLWKKGVFCVQCGHWDHADTNGGININGGEAILYYDRAAKPSLCADGSPEYPGLVCTPPTKQGSLAFGNEF